MLWNNNTRMTMLLSWAMKAHWKYMFGSWLSKTNDWAKPYTFGPNIIWVGLS